MLKGLRNIRLLISYDGTDFSGWQRQAGNRTVQGEIEAALEKLHSEKVGLTGSGRTDAGVHAAGQTANFYSSIKNIEASSFVPALNGLLPRDIRILKALEARPDFHSRFDAKSRTYRYVIICGSALPWELRYSWQIWRRPRVDFLNTCASLLLGETDCTVFAGTGDKSASRNRYISNAVFFIEQNKLVFEITANAFLWKMVRSITGTLLRWEEKNLAPETLGDVIASGSRRLAGPTAPPNGLFLWKIDYYRE
ncbi:MAG: tRNA pseudouridine(38-40) synthase TruA [Treponema sp.]|jgi:tRNA pseudouridine38-40 synthase|nr:tRNA pseudouridine(38-40) synthase TruA [Treponema sp.]